VAKSESDRSSVSSRNGRSSERVARTEADDGSTDAGPRLSEEPAGGLKDANHGLGASEVEDVQHQVKPLGILENEFLLRAG
jgi:hypothetical protein